jgi:orotate phosphoribosyltransferase
MQERVLGLLAGRSGHFQFESGHHGDLWLDLDRATSRPAVLRSFASELARRLAPYRAEAICGPLTGGAFLAHLLAGELDVAFCYAEHRARADNGTLDYRIPVALRAALRGRRVAVVDDAINAGSAVRATLADLDACDALPVAMAALLVLGQAAAALAAERGLPLERLAGLPNHLWTPDTCPLCAGGVPLDDGESM